MNGISGFQQRRMVNMLFALGDGFLILGGFFLGGMIRFQTGIQGILEIKHWGVKMVLLVIVTQTIFYYVDLYELRSFRQKIKMTVRLFQAMAISFVLLAIISYSLPSLCMGRGILAISLGLIFPMAVLWRFFYGWLVKAKIFKERILIIGSGDMAKKISSEIFENWRDSFEIVGFVDEKRGNIGKVA